MAFRVIYSVTKNKGRYKTMNKKLQKQLEQIAMENSYGVEQRGDLETRNSDEEDFLDISVWSLKEMLKQAYELGKKDGQK